MAEQYCVSTNRCLCHPETCCCNKWAVYNPYGGKHSTHYKKETAELVTKALNKQDKE